MDSARGTEALRDRPAGDDGIGVGRGDALPVFDMAAIEDIGRWNEG